MTDQDYDTGRVREEYDPDARMYSCPTLHRETAVEFVECTTRRGIKGVAVRGCRHCYAGLMFDVGHWLAVMYRHDNAGYLQFYDPGVREFEKFEKEDPVRAAEVKAAVAKVKDRRNAERKRKDAPLPQGWS